jgi:hypothetical protein
MRYVKIPLVTLFTLALICLAEGFIGTTQAQSTALERGYRTGYSDGYNAGFKDSSDRASRDYQSKDEYQRADRSYNEVWGPIEDYRDGYQQGFEAGYAAGYDRQQFNSSVPTGLRRRAAAVPVRQVPDNSSDQPIVNTSSTTTPVNTPVLIARDTVLVIELLSGISTDVSQRGDRFQARVVEPREYEGAIIDGRVTQVKRAGKVRGTAQLQLSFDTIRLADNRTASFSAVLIDVVNMGGDDVGSVDPEGGVRGRSSTKDDVSKVGAATGIGAIIGAIAGGGKGAAIGAAIGGGIGTGGVLSQRGKDIQLARGQQIKIRTSNDASIQ